MALEGVAETIFVLFHLFAFGLISAELPTLCFRLMTRQEKKGEVDEKRKEGDVVKKTNKR